MALARAALILLALAHFEVATANAQQGIGSCSEGPDAEVQVDDAEGIEVALFQTDVKVHRRQKKESILVQSKGVVDDSKREQLSKQDAQAPVTTTSWHKPTSRAEASGVKTNGEGDFIAFITALVTNVGMIVFLVGVFIVLKGWYPMTYCNNLKLNTAPLNTIPEGRFGWMHAALNATPEQVMDNCGLDQAMLLEFTNLAMRIMLLIGVPMFCIMGPINCVFGGHAAGMDHLSYFSFGNVVNESPLYWIHACIVWGVVFTVQTSIYAAQAKFLPLRYKWLRELPNPRNNTVLVEGIPDSCQSEAELNKFFTTMFGANMVQSTYIVKLNPELEDQYNLRETKKKALAKAKDDESLRSGIASEIKSLDEKIQYLQTLVKSSTKPGPDGKYPYASPTGFVTFKDASVVPLALSVQFGADSDDWQVSIPPDPSAVLWNDLEASEAGKSGLTLLGYLLTAGLFVAYMPSVVNITQIAVTINMGPFQPLWAAFAPTLGLQVMVAFLPTFLILIFQFCFTLKDAAFAQQTLQNWYFIFQVVFVLLITAIGSSVVEFMETLVESPLEVFPLLGKTMPQATHFYMNFLVLQWAAHAIEMIRAVQLGKWFMFRMIYDDETAREMSEPEDQDYYGLGSRSARFTINLCIGIVYGTLSPPINLLTFIDFAVCRAIYGYLIPFAETRKTDLGGHFWVQQLRHLFVANIIYCILMTGVLLGRAKTNGPGIIAALSFAYTFYSMRKFERSFSWERLPYKELVMGQEKGQEVKRKANSGEYIQPFMK